MRAIRIARRAEPIDPAAIRIARGSIQIAPLHTALHRAAQRAALAHQTPVPALSSRPRVANFSAHTRNNAVCTRFRGHRWPNDADCTTRMRPCSAVHDRFSLLRTLDCTRCRSHCTRCNPFCTGVIPLCGLTHRAPHPETPLHTR